jgi:RNase adapter protein RapZ
VSIDVRNLPIKDDLTELSDTYIKATHDPDINSTIIFIDADDQVLIKRYSETRRLHPLSRHNLSLNEAIIKEGELLKTISSVADLRIDTTNLSIHDLCQQVITTIQGKPFKKLVVIFESFGYKDGITKDADFVFDSRFLPNPYWDKSIRDYCGLEDPIKNFFMKYPEVDDYINRLDDLLTDILPSIEMSDRSYLTVAVGCTGGFHRSVFIAQSLADRFLERGMNVKVRHRSLLKKKNLAH